MVKRVSFIRMTKEQAQRCKKDVKVLCAAKARQWQDAPRGIGLQGFREYFKHLRGDPGWRDAYIAYLQKSSACGFSHAWAIAYEVSSAPIETKLKPSELSDDALQEQVTEILYKHNDVLAEYQRRGLSGMMVGDVVF